MEIFKNQKYLYQNLYIYSVWHKNISLLKHNAFEYCSLWLAMYKASNEQNMLQKTVNDN